MKYSFIIVAALLIAAPASAFAQSERMTDARYLAASRCVAYAELPQLQGDAFDVGSLKQAMEAHRALPIVQDRARGYARDARLAGGRAGDSERGLVQLRQRRDDACANFVSNGLVQAEAAAPSS